MSDTQPDSTTSPDDANQTPHAETDPTETAAPADALATARQEQQALQDRLLRTVAEFDNYRKRVDRERRDLVDYAATEILSELLPIVDDLERALQADPGDGAAAYQQGVELILKQMGDLLRKRGVTPIEALGTDFDPNFHQAVAHDVSTKHRDGEIMEELRRGYMLRDRLLRATMVKVAKAS